MKFARRAARLIQHRGIEKQRDARDEWRLLLPRFGRFAAPGRRLASLAEFRVQREVTAELPAIFGAPVLRARQRRCQFAKKKVDRLFFLRSEFAQLLFAEKSGQCGTGFNNQGENDFAADRLREFPIASGSAENSATIIGGHVVFDELKYDAIVHQRREHVVRECAAVDRE